MSLSRQWRKVACLLAGGELIQTRRAHGRDVRVPVHADGSARHAFREPWMDTLLPRLLAVSPEPVFFDVGANIGQGLLALMDHGATARYVGFEPNARNYAYLQRLIELNERPRTSAFPVALSESFGVASLGVRKQSFDVFCSLSTDVHEEGFFRFSQDVLMTTGDMVAEALGVSEITLLKVDVEGAELEVLKGFRGVFAKAPPAIVFEILPAAAEAGEEDLRVAKARALSDLLTGFGYRFRQICGAGLGPVQDSLDPRRIGSLDDSNFLAVPPGHPES